MRTSLRRVRICTKAPAQQILSCCASTSSARAQFNLQQIRELKPFPHWLAQEMRSNHAGETGAVCIYSGALWALQQRKHLSWSNNSWEDQVEQFAREHQASERWHLELLEGVLTPDERSMLLPAWRISGWCLGAISTIWCPRGLYVTTEAVESFVESHYLLQIRRLRDEADSAGSRELLKMLETCCADEVAHKVQARERAAQGPLPWFEVVDTLWHALVSQGSLVAAAIAKRI